MLRISLTTAILLFLTTLEGVAAANPQASAAPSVPMQLFTSSDGHFSVMMPGTPVQASEQAKLSDNVSIAIHEFTISLNNDNISYLVMYNDYPAGYAEDTPQNVLARTRDGAVKTKTLNSDQAIDLTVSAGPDPASAKDASDRGGATDGAVVPGRAFISSDTDGYNYSVRQYLRDKRLYQLIVVTNKGFTAPEAEEFMNSFKVF